MKILVEHEGYKLIKRNDAFYIRLFVGEIVPILCEFKIDKEEGSQIIENHSLIVDTVKEYSRNLDWTLSSFVDATVLDYLQNTGMNEKRAKDSLVQLREHEDILMEFYDYILLEKFPANRAIEVCEYNAQMLYENYELSIIGAYNYLIYLREEPDEALADLKAKLPRRTLFDENKIKEANGMDENKNPVLEEETKESEVIEQAETEEVVEENATPEDVAPESEVTDESVEQQSEEHNGGEDDSMGAVLEMLEKLQKSFDDKIAEDEYKNKLFDNMHKELTAHQNGAFDKVINTMAMDIIQLVDSIKKNVKIYEKKEPIEENYKKLLRIVKGLGQDLDDILYRQSIEPYSVSGKEVDVKRQKIIQIIDTDDQAKDNTIAARTADGYEKDGKVLRPERIKIYKYNPDAPKED